MRPTISHPTTMVALTCLLGALLAVSAAAAEAELEVGSGPAAPGKPVATVQCTSGIGDRQHCAADTSAGVLLARSTGAGACLLGKTWGYDDAGVWVSDGCGGEFVVRQAAPEGPAAPAPAPAPPPAEAPPAAQPEPALAAAAEGMEEGAPVEEVVKEVEAAKEGRKPTERIETWSVYEPGAGYLLGRTKRGELAISAYAMARYMNQNDEDQVYTDHLGTVRPVDTRHDIFGHRIMVFLKGWMVDPKLVYNITFWTVSTTDQDALFASLGYQFSKKFSLYVGLTGNPGSRSLLGSHPFWLAHDRVMADEFFRPYFGSGLTAVGELFPGFWYDAALTNNNSSLGVRATQLDRKFTWGNSVWWMPTTHEFGPRGSYGDWEYHEDVATRFGASYVDSPEQSFRSSEGGSPENTTLKLADGVNIFETGSLAPGVTMEEVDYRILSVDAGVKYKGVFVQAEVYQRWLGNFLADGVLPVSEIEDWGFYVQAAFYPIPKVLEVYGITSQIFGDEDAGFEDSSEYGVGMNWYPFDTRNHRLNVQVLDVNTSPVGSTFGYYTAGQDGITAATSFSIFF
jgi:hypothetical protein